MAQWNKSRGSEKYLLNSGRLASTEKIENRLLRSGRE